MLPLALEVQFRTTRTVAAKFTVFSSTTVTHTDFVLVGICGIICKFDAELCRRKPKVPAMGSF